MDAKQRIDMTLKTLLGEFSVTMDPQEFAHLYARIQSLPERVSEMAGEPIDLQVENQGDRAQYSVHIDLFGRKSNTCYFTFSHQLENQQGTLNLDAIHHLTLVLWCAFNRPDQVPEWVLESLADRGTPWIECDYCDRSFTLWQEALDHEAAAHDTSLN